MNQNSKMDGIQSALLRRFFWLLVICFSTIVFGFAFVLEPDPSGQGTHTQLGLPPCGFEMNTAIPCPGCGLTTSFAWMARLSPLRAAQANLWGVFLFLVLILMFFLSVWGFWKNKPVIETLLFVQLEWVLMVLALAGAFHWAVRIWY